MVTTALAKLGRIKSSENAQVTYKDTGASKIAKQLRKLQGLSLTVGFQGQSALTVYEDGEVNVATVAMFNEFGTSNAPERPFMRRSVSANRNLLSDDAARLFGAVVALRMTAEDALFELGRIMAENMSAQIDGSQRWAIPNAESTIAKKGHDQPLLDIGLMQESISWAVRSGSALGPIIRQGQL